MQKLRDNKPMCTGTPPFDYCGFALSESFGVFYLRMLKKWARVTKSRPSQNAVCWWFRPYFHLFDAWPRRSAMLDIRKLDNLLRYKWKCLYVHFEPIFGHILWYSNIFGSFQLITRAIFKFSRALLAAFNGRRLMWLRRRRKRSVTRHAAGSLV